MRIAEGRIIPGVSIGEYYIGMKKEDLIKKLGDDYINRSMGGGNHKILLENAMIWIDENDLVRQIGVSRGFHSAYQNKIRIGTTLNEITEMYGGYENRDVTYNLIGVDGLCFELEDVDEFEYLDESDILRSPIEWIFVYRITDERKAEKQITEGQVVPGIAIGEYYIGMEKKELEKKLGLLYLERWWGNGKQEIISGNAKIGFDENGLINKIGVTKGFQNAYQDKIRIGTTLNEIKEMYGGYEESDGTYKLAGVDGLYFVLEDVDGFEYLDESEILRLSIKWIFVYRISDR